MSFDLIHFYKLPLKFTFIAPDINPTEEEQKEVAEILEEREKQKALQKKVDNCSYDLGYKSQEVYACKTCYRNKEIDQVDSKINNFGEKVEPAGICLGCLVHCHSGHEVYELYRKSNFKCDCGNLKINQECMLNNQKELYNEQNRYSHNFYGRYWYCEKEYLGEEEMYQCTFCEDWFHLNHLTPDATELVSKLNEDDKDWRLMWSKCAENYQDCIYNYTHCILNYDDAVKSLKQKEDKKPTTEEDNEKEKKNEKNPEVFDDTNDKTGSNQPEQTEKDEKDIPAKIEKPNAESISRKRPFNQISQPDELVINDTNEESKNNEKRALQSQPWEDAEKLIKIDKNPVWKLLKPVSEKIPKCDLILNDKFINSLCNWDNEKCVQFKNAITDRISQVENFSQEEILLDRALLQGMATIEEEDPLELSDEKEGYSGSTDVSNNPETTHSSRPSDATEIFTENVVRQYPNVTPHQRHAIANGLEKAIVGLFEFHNQNKKDENDKEITKDTVLEYLEKLKTGNELKKPDGDK